MRSILVLALFLSITACGKKKDGPIEYKDYACDLTNYENGVRTYSCEYADEECEVYTVEFGPKTTTCSAINYEVFK